MHLSTEQTRAVMHGIDNRFSWHEIDRPVGPQPIPDWCADVHVNWHEGYGNSPSVKLKTNCDARKWPEKRFRRVGNCYVAEHPDGRAEQYAHNGEVKLRDHQMFKRADGTIHKDRRTGPEWGDEDGIRWTYPGEERCGFEPGEWVQAQVLATTQQEGFGGATTWVTMEDGREIALRGPWHVGAPDGFAEVSYVNIEDRWNRNSAKSGRKRKWHQSGGVGGLYLRLDTFVRIMSRFAPHLPLASVTYGGATTIEPFKAEWGEPKRLVLERDRASRLAVRGAA